MIKTERLVLKTAREVTAEQVLAYYQCNKAFLKPYEPTRPEDFYTIATHEQNLQQDIIQMEEGRGIRFFITLPQEEKVIGILNFSQIIMGAFLSCYVGYSLDKNWNGHGYMSEALREGVSIMFEEYGLHRIEGNVMPRNTRSIEVLKRIGFEAEGLAKHYLKINGVWEDHIHYVLLNE